MIEHDLERHSIHLGDPDLAATDDESANLWSQFNETYHDILGMADAAKYIAFKVSQEESGDPSETVAAALHIHSLLTAMLKQMECQLGPQALALKGERI